MSKYRVASQEGVDLASRVYQVVEIGNTVDLDLSKDTEQAVIAAGWLEHVEKPAKADK